ncbi:hypothetical protein MNBD_GAMMA09-2270 [hydrothermal vent metagenome]|uniref:DUF4178 domain-containing protein n=1 Tax=hydrothermal vent metagenome TaxID=652676 RepID=A0A3B0XWP3_9ZZZZ
MGFLKSLFGGGDEPSPPRNIDSPQALLVGDIMKMEFAEQSVISAQTLKVKEQVFYDLSAVEKCKAVSVMDGVDRQVYVSYSSVNPDRPLEIAVSILPDDVFALFKEKDFVAIFDEPDNTDHRLKRSGHLNAPDFTEGFVADSYYQERTNEAYRSTKDCRNARLRDDEWSAFDYKLMVADNRQHAVRIEVFDGGRTDVYLIAYLALNKVENYWPAT